jgi:hypothetical protein
LNQFHIVDLSEATQLYRKRNAVFRRRTEFIYSGPEDSVFRPKPAFLLRPAAISAVFHHATTATAGRTHL